VDLAVPFRKHVAAAGGEPDATTQLPTLNSAALPGVNSIETFNQLSVSAHRAAGNCRTALEVAVETVASMPLASKRQALLKCEEDYLEDYGRYNVLNGLLGCKLPETTTVRAFVAQWAVHTISCCIFPQTDGSCVIQSDILGIHYLRCKTLKEAQMAAMHHALQSSVRSTTSCLSVTPELEFKHSAAIIRAVLSKEESYASLSRGRESSDAGTGVRRPRRDRRAELTTDPDIIPSVVTR
jgi:hypothetical protein